MSTATLAGLGCLIAFLVGWLAQSIRMDMQAAHKRKTEQQWQRENDEMARNRQVSDRLFALEQKAEAMETHAQKWFTDHETRIHSLQVLSSDALAHRAALEKRVSQLEAYSHAIGGNAP